MTWDFVLVLLRQQSEQHGVGDESRQAPHPKRWRNEHRKYVLSVTAPEMRRSKMFWVAQC